MNPGEYADILRAVGRFLDDQSPEGVLDVHISDLGSHLAVRWRNADLSQIEAAYKELDLEALREQAVGMRQGQAGMGPRNPGLTRAEFLRTLGQDLDAGQIEFSTIVELEDGYLVSGTQRRGYFRQNFLFTTLQEESQERRRMRAVPRAAAPARAGPRRAAFAVVPFVVVALIILAIAAVFVFLNVSGPPPPAPIPTPVVEDEEESDAEAAAPEAARLAGYRLVVACCAPDRNDS